MVSGDSRHAASIMPRPGRDNNRIRGVSSHRFPGRFSADFYGRNWNAFWEAITGLVNGRPCWGAEADLLLSAHRGSGISPSL